MERFNKLKAERASLAEKLRLIAAQGNVITLHPAAIDKFASAIEAMHADRAEQTETLREVNGAPLSLRVRAVLVHQPRSDGAMRGRPTPGLRRRWASSCS